MRAEFTRFRLTRICIPSLGIGWTQSEDLNACNSNFRLDSSINAVTIQYSLRSTNGQMKPMFTVMGTATNILVTLCSEFLPWANRELPLHSPEVAEWFAISAQDITDPFLCVVSLIYVLFRKTPRGVFRGGGATLRHVPLGAEAPFSPGRRPGCRS